MFIVTFAIEKNDKIRKYVEKHIYKPKLELDDIVQIKYDIISTEFLLYDINHINVVNVMKLPM